MLRAMCKHLWLCFAQWLCRLGQKAFAEYGPVLMGCTREGILVNHFYMDKINLEHCPGTSKVKNYRNVRALRPCLS